MVARIQTYRDFWPFYVSQHLNVTCRRLHFFGTTLTLVSFALAVTASPWFLAAAPVAGYLFAWIGHFVFEKNRPATFTYPIWSLIADFQMYGLIATGKMDTEIEKVLRSNP